MSRGVPPARDCAITLQMTGRGVQYPTVRYTERLDDKSIVALVRSKGDSHENTMASRSTGSTRGI